MDYFNPMATTADTFKDNTMLYGETFSNSNADMNADLNDFFSDESAFQPYINQQTTTLAQPSWDDGLDLLEDDFDAQPSNQLAIDPSAIGSSGSTTDALATTAEAPATEEVSAPRRGRPRKSRAKKQLTPQQEHAKRQKFLERNRLAASKCRDRRKIHTEEMLKKYKRAQDLNHDLRAQVLYMRSEFERMMAATLAHQQSGCTDNGVLKVLNNPELLELLSSNFDEISMSIESSPSRESSVTPSRHQSFSSSARDSGFSSMGSVKTESPRNFDDEGYVSREPRAMMTNPRLGPPVFSVEPGHSTMFGQ